MPKPPHWLPWLGPGFAGIAAGLAVNVWPFAGFLQIVLISVVVGLVPSVGGLIWRKLWERKNGPLPPKPPTSGVR
ncbi:MULTISPECIES: hypothetical protein [Brevundimonas]|uniref:hypothetical protein n=1 Tax=Brevundimonas TaxID=41275 RepID=UPI000F042CDE|nr:hypothetical protein [Brevundimonas lutea]